MSIFKDLQKSFKSHHMIALLGVVILIAAFSQYSGRKGMAYEGNDPTEKNHTNNQDLLGESPDQRQKFYNEASGSSSQVPSAANQPGQNSDFASVSGLTTTTTGLPPSCTKQPVSNPADLLPKDTHNEFARLNPKGSQDLRHVNLLKSGYHAGINTVGGSLRNANLQVRSEPPNPTTKVSPWGNTTIEPDLMRVPLEIGCGPQ